MLRVFILYARENISDLVNIVASVKNIFEAKEADFWYDEKITGGADIKDSINEEIRRADLFVPLISRDFINSDWCLNGELRPAYAETKRRRCFIMPIVLRDCDWENIALELRRLNNLISEIKYLRDLKTYMEPRCRLDNENPDVFYSKACKAIRRMLSDIRSTTRECQPVSLIKHPVFLGLNNSCHTWCEFIEVNSLSAQFWIGSRPLPLIDKADKLIRPYQRLIRLRQGEIGNLINSLCQHNHIQFRIPTWVEWQYAITVNGTSRQMPDRLRPSDTEPRWGNYAVNEIGIYAPCLGADEWVGECNRPEMIATVYRGANGPEANFRHYTGIYSGVHPAIRLVCDSILPS